MNYILTGDKRYLRAEWATVIVKIFRTNHLTPEYFINSKLGHTTLLSTVFSPPFCVLSKRTEAGTGRDLNSEPTAVDKTMDHLFVIT